MIESLSVRAVAQRASKYSPEDDEDNVGDCLISCEMENLSQVSEYKFIRAVAQRASKYSPEDDEDNVGDCLISCEMENLSQVREQ